MKKQTKVNWHRVITLSAAGKYIQDQLDKEIKNIKLPKKGKR